MMFAQVPADEMLTQGDILDGCPIGSTASHR